MWCPDCPSCGHPPLVTDLFPFFCSNTECMVVAWNPHQPPAEARGAEWVEIEFTTEYDEPQS